MSKGSTKHKMLIDFYDIPKEKTFRRNFKKNLTL